MSKRGTTFHGPLTVFNPHGRTWSTQVAKATLSPNQIKTCRATPVPITPAPESNQLLIPRIALFTFNYVAPAYTGTGANLSLCWTDGASVGLFDSRINDDGSILKGTFSRSWLHFPFDTGVAPYQGNTNLPLFLGKPLGLVNTGAAEFATGNGTLEVILHYDIMEV